MINRIMFVLSVLLVIPAYGVSLKSMQEKLGRKIDQLMGKKPDGNKKLPDFPKDRQTREELIDFLSIDPVYRGKRDLQYGFLGRFNISDKEKQDLMNKVATREQYTF